MKAFKKLLLVSFLACGIVAKAQNPIIQTKYTADPAPLVYHDTVYLYTSHDEDDAPAGQGNFLMRNWLCYTSTDMVNWTDHGIVASLRNFDWADKAVSGGSGFENGAWAPQVIQRNGKFYMYCPVQGRGIGVLVADKPYGPFRSPLNKPLIGPEFDSIDPTVFIDTDGQAYLYWGNPNCWYVKLNKDMTSFTGEPVKIDTKPSSYQEGPWLYKHGSDYYLAFASTCCPEGIGYAMSDSPTGPWVYKGSIMDGDKRSTGNHPGIIDYKGNSYVFGFNFAINFARTSVHHERRSVCLEKLTYNPDGTINKLPFWSATGVDQLGTLNPFKRTEAETINLTDNIKTAKDSVAGMYVTNINNDDFIRVRGVNFDKGARSFEANVAAGTEGGAIAIHIDAKDGKLLGTCRVDATGGLNQWITKQCAVQKISGVHDLYFVFKGNEANLFNFNWWKFIK